jgi:hypothetical protein
VGDERYFAITGFDGGYGVGDVNHKGRTTNGSVVGKSGLDPQVLGGGHRGKSGGENAVHVILGESGVRQGIVGRFRMVLQRRFIRDRTHFVGLGHSNDGDIALSGTA